MSEWINTSKDRLEKLETYVDALITGEAVRDTFYQYEEVIKHITPFDVFNLSHFSQDTGLSVLEIKAIAGKVMKSFNHGLSRYPWPHMETSLFVKYLLEEMQAFKLILDQIRPLLRKEKIELHYSEIRRHVDSLSVFEMHAHKMQYVLFPMLEKRIENTKPFSVLWSVQDDVLRILKELISALDASLRADAIKKIGLLYYTLFGLFEKEELLVLPIASRVLTQEDWDALLKQAAQIGFAFREEPIEVSDLKEDSSTVEGAVFQTTTGGMTHEQLHLVLNHLGVDFTLVDESDRVAYFNNPKERFFPRSSAIVGRHVRDCHPPESVHIVEDIIQSFRRNKQSTASFWLTHKGKDIVIHYYALRDASNVYKGILEVSQDVTTIKQLKGERRLLEWESNPFRSK